MSYKLAGVIWNDDGTMETKETSPLESLEALKFLVDNYGNFEFDFSTLETALKKLEQLEEEKQSFDRQLEKKLKALEIIKEKEVNVNALVKYIKTNAVDDTPLCWYNEYIALFEDNRTLTEEEYDLLKEVLL